MEIDSLNDSFSECLDWALKTGIWDGRIVSREELPEFSKEIGSNLLNFFFSKDPSSLEFQQAAAMLARLGSDSPLLERDIQALRLSPNGVVLQAGFGKSIAKFWKEHKVEIIVGAIVVTGIVVAIIVSTTTAGAAAAPLAAAGGAALDNLCNEKPSSKSKPSEQEPPLPVEITTLEETISPEIEQPDLSSLNKNQASSFKENIIQEQFFQTTNPAIQNQGLSWEENARALGFLFAHNSYNNLQNQILYYPRLAQEVEDINFGLGQCDRSLEDYKQFPAQAQKRNPLSVSEFSLGVARGLPKGVYESGEGLFLFMADFVKHPIQTSTQLLDSGAALVKLVREDKWGIIAEALCPEMHQVVTEWDTLSSEKRGELIGYAIGKHGTDILAPAGLAKLASKSVKSAQELAAVCKNIQIAQETLLLETAAEIGNSAKIAEVLEAAQKTAFLAEELGFTAREAGQLKQAGILETTLAKRYDHLSLSMQESIALHKRARDTLKPYVKNPMPEMKVRELIHEAGLPTFSKPKNIPENYIVRITDRGAGMEYVHPTNTHLSVRVMPGKPHSPHPHQQKPYVIQMKDGKAFDKHGNLVPHESPEAHIPANEFIYRE